MSTRLKSVYEFLGLATTQEDLGTLGAGTSTPDLSKGLYKKITLSAATRTIANPTYRGAAVATGSIPAGSRFFIQVHNASGGAVTVTLGSLFKASGRTEAANGTFRVYVFLWDGANFRLENNGVDSTT